jgi:CubicO group peptidase (beta-lactamase class C family)
MLVLRDGVVLFAEGRSGITEDSLHLLASGTKSFCGIAAAIAIEDGLLSLDEKVADTIEEWKDDPRKSRVTVRQLLSLASGLESLSAKIDNQRSAAAHGITDRAQASIAAPLQAAPGERFIYGPSSFYVFGELLRRKLAAAETGDRDIVDYLERKVFVPLGIKPVFLRDEAGNPNMAGGGRISARDWAIFGEMVLDRGVAHGADGPGNRIVSDAMLREVLSSHGPNPRYGLTWWLLNAGDDDPEDGVAADLLADRLAAQDSDGPVRREIRRRLAENARTRRERATAEKDDTRGSASDATGGDLTDASDTAKPEAADSNAARTAFMAAGKGKQRLYVLPADDLVVVRFGTLEGGRDFADAEFLRLLRGVDAVEEGRAR